MSAPNAEYERPAEPAVPALEAWWKRPDTRSHHGDKPSVSVWMPQDAPSARLYTITRADRSEYLPDPDRATASLYLGGVELGGYLHELEQLIDAARDALRLARHYADCLTAEQAHIDGSASVTGGDRG